VFVIKSDGVYTYTFNHANQLVSASGAGTTVSYGYNGQGDRVSQTAGITTTTYTLDLAAGLTQVLADGTDAYLYGDGRIAQYSEAGPEYFLGDALGSVRQLVDANGELLLAQSYEPYGAVLESAGKGTSSYGFTAEMRDSYIKLIYLRSREYSPATGRFLTQDSWQGDYTRPLSLNGWNYVEGNPINFVDPSGFIKETESNTADQILDKLKNDYEVLILKDYGQVNGGYGSCEKGWYPGAWRTLEELQLVEEGIDKAVSVMGGSGKFKSAMRGQVVIRRLGIPEIDFSVIPIIGPYIGSQPRAFAPPGGLIDVALPDEVFNHGDLYARYTTVHELGHVWDRRTSLRLSNGLMLYMGTLVCQGMGGCYFDIKAGKELPPGDSNQDKVYAGVSPMEDWAEAFASTIYETFNTDYFGATFNNIGKLREKYVRDQFAALP
jgi:RHS repeat-associated protein